MRISSVSISLMSVFASLHAVLYFLPSPLWRSLAIYLMPLEGIILGPWVGTVSSFIGCSVARIINPDKSWMFGVIAEPVSVLSCGLLSRGRWAPVLSLYTAMLVAYFIHPLGRSLPLWTIIDLLALPASIYLSAKLSKQFSKASVKQTSIFLTSISFSTISVDSLVRVFLLVPAELHVVLGWSPEAVYFEFVAGAVLSYIEDAVGVVFSLLVGTPLLQILKNSKYGVVIFRW